jgi:WD40 repeat protein
MLLISSCGTPANIEPTNTLQTPTLTDTATIIPTSTPSPTATITRVPSKTPTTTPVPLTAEGPFFICSGSEGIQFYDSQMQRVGKVLPSILVPYRTHVSELVSSRGDFFAIGVRGESNDFQLWTYHLPDFQIVKKIELLSTEAKIAIGNFDPDEIIYELCQQKCDYSPLVETYISGRFLKWSPDGRYLAFAGALDGNNTDVYLYDTISGDIKLLSSEIGQVEILGWSPDSKWIVYSEFACIETVGSSADNVWVIKTDGTDSKRVISRTCPGYVATNNHEKIIGWISNNQAIMDISVYESYSIELKRVIMDSGTSIKFPLCFHLNVEVVHGTPAMFVNINEFKSCYPPLPYGLYHMNFLDNSFTLIEPLNLIREMQAYPQIKAMAVYGSLDDYEHYTELNTYLYSAEGQRIAVFDGPISVSPDGQWIIVRKEDRITAFDRFGNYQTEFTNIGQGAVIIWKPDSSGFYQFTQTSKHRNSEVFIYSFENISQIQHYRLDNHCREYALIEPEK